MTKYPPITYDKPIWRQLDPERAKAYDALPEEQRQKLNEAAAKELEVGHFFALGNDFFGDEEVDGGEDESFCECSGCGDEDHFSLKTCEVCGCLICPTCRSTNRLRVLCTGCDPDCLDPYSDDY
jgi:hypothetical protein